VAWQDDTGVSFDIDAVRIPRSPHGPLQGPFYIVPGPTDSRSPSLLSNGDKVLVVYADNQPGSFDLMLSMFDNQLNPLATRVPITHAPQDSVYPAARRGGNNVGILFNDERDGNWEMYFTSLLCVDPLTP
jgi:hypothetical protein